MNSEIRVLIEYRVEQAQQSLRSARLLLHAGDALGAVNRAYYCAFYCVLALLASKQIGTGKHSGAIAQFHRHFAKPGLFEASTAGLVNRLFELRLHGDYRDLKSPTTDDAGKAAGWAEQFFLETRRVLERDTAVES